MSFISSGVRFPRERFSVIPLGLDLDRFLALEPREGDADRDAVALYAGRLVPIKRVDLLIRALARARAAGARLRLVVLGDGELRAELERLASSLGVARHVSFLGYREDVIGLDLDRPAPGRLHRVPPALEEGRERLDMETLRRVSLEVIRY